MTILGDPIKDDPWGAMIVLALLAARRILRKDTSRMNNFLEHIASILETGILPDRPVDGPMSGILLAVGDLHLRGTINVNDLEFNLQQEDGPQIDLFHRSAEVVKDAIRRWVRTTILGGLAKQCRGE